MRRLFAFCLPAIVTLLLVACGEKKQDAPDPNARQKVNIPVERNTEPEVDVSHLDTLRGLKQLPAVERELFLRTVQVQIPYYENLEKWADEANKIRDGKAAAISLRRYLDLQNAFELRRQKIDQEFAGRIDPNYAGSAEFNRVLERYLTSADVDRRGKYILESAVSLMQRFKDDPACQDIFAEIRAMSEQQQ
ncbi:MAG TPA: hypothetical protein PK916_04495 [Bacteroidota bacterium]|nr:hypothetical protein [Bacteroidota bacterium]